jgi:hypothetical protein
MMNVGPSIRNNLLAEVDRLTGVHSGCGHETGTPGAEELGGLSELLGRARDPAALHEPTDGGATMNPTPTERTDLGQVAWYHDEVAEISLLMPAWQTTQLLDLAVSKRLTVGQLLRGLVHTYLAQRSPAPLLHQRAANDSTAYPII